MTDISSRSYLHPDDLPRLIDFLKRVRPPAWIAEYPGIVDLHEALDRPAVREGTRLWVDAAGQLLGFGFVMEPYNNLYFEIRPEAEASIEAEVIDWGIRCVSKFISPQDCHTLDANSREDDVRRIALLERQGFARQAGGILRMVRPLDQTLPAATVPAGFSIRPVAGESDVDGIVALHRAAFGTQNMTRETRLSIMHAPGYDPALDLLAVAADGRFAGYCTGFISAEENAASGRSWGHTDPVAVHPQFAGRGLAAALLLTCMHRLVQRDMRWAVLGTSGENIAMQRAAGKAGFYVESRRIWLSKPLPGASEQA